MAHLCSEFTVSTEGEACSQVGVVAPLVLSALAIAAVSPGLAVAGALCGLLGALFLRQVVLAGGIHAPLRAGSFEVPLPIV